MNHTSVFPPVSPGRAREVDAAGGVCWGAQKQSGPESAGNTRRDLAAKHLNRYDREDSGL